MTTPASITIERGDLADERVLRLLRDHLDDMFATSPPESVHALDVSGLEVPEVTFWTIAEGGDILGCVALKELDPGHGELKSMRTDAESRGRGLGARLLEHVLAEAARRGYGRVSLETGSQDFFRPARTLYQRYGFRECGPFGDYVLDPHSVFMTLELEG
ncbi:putative acetyltransferase [Agromyces flavus]|uniref:Acetyltransferase n=1 Tax=Agromyces flavus TaxID=589382 RepID=A0A1H1VZ90_9MICO|nr:GNAT family N-acetyltransferase [Agromyces flavus]MCP2366040.1 putative acetyltransferase [Agromyces flavus]GGI43879.1 N-acetyltransferase [Agromyces flavus]SDS89760.1 putative acetyltransferase [Agromyces flavus]